MNKIFCIVLLFLIALAALGGVLLSDAGYILLQWRGVAIETSAVVFTIFLLISASVIIGLFHIMMRLFEISAHFRTWRKTRSHGKISQKLNQGILDLLQENWQSASAALKSVGSHKDFDAIRLLGLANAAQGEGDFKTRDTMMQQLETVVGSKNALSVGLAHAELYSQAGQGEQAIAVLNTLHQKFPKHPIALKRLVEQYAQHAQWRELHSLLPAAKRLNAISDDQLNQYTTQYYAVEFDAWIELAQQERQHLTQTNTQDIEKQGIENSGAQRIETRLTQQLTTTMWKQIPDQMLKTATRTVSNVMANCFQMITPP
ncbi:MAG: heme biosynthesis HemY N-terminal domain-containing protein [Gammaproteobacteria bacterium]